MAESTARSSSAAVDSAWNWRPSCTAIPLNALASSSNSSRLVTLTRLPKSRCAMRLVPSRSSASGTRLRRIWLRLSTSTPMPDSRTTQMKVWEKWATGPSTSSSVSLSVSVQVGPANTSSSRIGQVEETKGRPVGAGMTAGEGLTSGAASVIGSACETSSA